MSQKQVKRARKAAKLSGQTIPPKRKGIYAHWNPDFTLERPKRLQKFVKSPDGLKAENPSYVPPPKPDRNMVAIMQAAQTIRKKHKDTKRKEIREARYSKTPIHKVETRNKSV